MISFFESNYIFYLALSGLFLSFLGMYVGTACISLGSTLLLLFGLPLFFLKPKKLGFQKLLVAYLMLLLAIALSVFFADPYPFWKPVLKLRYFLCFFASAAVFYRKPEVRTWFSKAALFLSFVLGILAPLQFLGILSIPEVLLGVEPNPITGFPHFFQATGLLRHHTAFGLSVIYLFHFLLADLLTSQSSQNRKLLLLGCGVCVVAIFCSFSRGTWLTWFFSTVIVLFIQGDMRKKLLFLTLVSILVAAAFTFSPTFRDRISSLSLNQNSDRLELWQFAFDEIKKNPVFGHGFGRFPYELEKYPERLARSGGHGHAHNIYLDMEAGAGILGLLGLLWFFALIAQKLKRNLENQEGWDLSLVGVFTAFLFGSLFDEFLLWNQTLIPTLAILGSAFVSGASPLKSK